MTYLRLDNRRKRNPNADIAKAVIVLLILIAIFYIFAQPLTHALRWVQSTISRTFMSSPTVRNEDDNVLIKTLELENTQLKELLGRKSASDNTILAAVLVRPPKSPYDTIVIDAGTAQGVTQNMVVYGELQYAIGKVTEVTDKNAVVTLFSSSNQKVDVIIGATASGTAAVAEGRGGGNFYIKLPRNVVINVGDPIIWPSSSLVLLGTVEKVDADMGGTYSHIYFKSPINIQSLRYVQLKESLY